MVRSSTITGRVLAVAALFASGITTVSAECTREGLIASANTFLKAVAAGSTSGLSLSATNFTYKENNHAADIKKSYLSTPLKIDLSRITADTVECASYTMFISAGGTKPYVVSTQIRHPGDDTTQIALIDSIVASTGALFFNAKKTLDLVSKETWTPLAAANQTSRETLKKFGDGYLDMWTDAKAADRIAWGTDCERVEGSQLTRPCGASLPHGGSTKNNGNRRYVIDEVMGSVDVLCSFDSLGNYADSHEIRAESGKVKYVHTVTILLK
ncbi:hypothetical protein B0T25DRAFT_303141 [Lasiosphaeria hispida]|uniref:DUF8021 domain-containing protein n=1 Tax=Lasiosphaeria hispida TaxID=260671 RepID=A0AAJ0H8V2_9PEZI|nr:hypothetical protein B0T25DRAFT_303141 [Lasiosphaeria hispida]